MEWLSKWQDLFQSLGVRSNPTGKLNIRIFRCTRTRQMSCTCKFELYWMLPQFHKFSADVKTYQSLRIRSGPTGIFVCKRRLLSLTIPSNKNGPFWCRFPYFKANRNVELEIKRIDHQVGIDYKLSALIMDYMWSMVLTGPCSRAWVLRKRSSQQKLPLRSCIPVKSCNLFTKSSVVALFFTNPMYSVNLLSVKAMLHAL